LTHKSSRGSRPHSSQINNKTMASWKPFETFEIRGDTYVILSLVGEGVFGRVFETLRLLDNKIYAVKELTAYSTLPADAIRYFEQEVANLNFCVAFLR
jgi:serine/threonine protein kinase